MGEGWRCGLQQDYPYSFLYYGLYERCEDADNRTPYVLCPNRRRRRLTVTPRKRPPYVPRLSLISPLPLWTKKANVHATQTFDWFHMHLLVLSIRQHKTSQDLYQTLQLSEHGLNLNETAVRGDIVDPAGVVQISRIQAYKHTGMAYRKGRPPTVRPVS